ncbi:MAG: hypothetical protein QF464_16470, partial [Myxococcota bacterium]|nr:hypothetical protein [Myxococcota bacterium]
QATVTPEPPKPVAPTSFEASVKVSGVTVSGSLPKSAIAKAARHLSGKFKACYKAMAKKAGRAPRVTLKVHGTIDVDGRARAVKARGSGLPGLAPCVRSAAARLRSRTRPDTGTVKMSFEVRFVPQG